MNLRVLIGLGALLAVGASGSALAFQEQQGGSSPPPAEAAPAAPAPNAEVPAGNLDFSKGGGASKDADAGTEVRIPGLGRLGVLPKMDFGLELLYGANDQSKPVEPEVRELPNDDLTIRGSLKHNF